LGNPTVCRRDLVTVYAIIVNYRTAEMTIDAGRSLLASDLSRIDLRLLLVDNGSDDGSSQKLQAAFPAARHFATQSNFGYAGGNNVALRALLANVPPNIDYGDAFVLLMNSDVLVDPDALRTCLGYIRGHERTGVVGPRVLLQDGRLDLACRRSFPTPASGFWKLTGLARRFPDNARFARYNLTYLDEHETAEVDAVMGAFMLVRLEAIIQAGILDESFFFYGEDLDWTYRIKAHGWKVVYYPEATVHHLKGGTSRRNSNRMIVEFYRSMWLFYRKHYAERRTKLLEWVVLAGIVARGMFALGVNALRPAGRKRVS
jgi:N-acetylglucosaminyl-diphospho-decaprenol L-rhamnosyltransferase